MKRPEIRFEGFDEEWEKRKLGDLATFSKGAGYSKSDLKDSGTPIILYGRLYTKYETIIHDVDTFVDAKNGSVYSEGGEVIVPASGETAEDISIASVVENPGVLLGGDLNIIHPNNIINPTFLAISVSHGEPHLDMARRAQGKSIVHLHNEDLSQIELRYPSLAEQQNIGQFFRSVDNFITLHQRKLDTLQNLKKSMLEKMFPKEGETKPEIRFEGFTDDWEQRKLGDVCSLLVGYPFESKQFSDEGIKLVRGMNIKRGYLDFSDDICRYWETSAGLEDYLLEKDDILIQMDGALIGQSYAIINENQLPALLVQRVTRVRHEQGCSDADFLYSAIQRDFLAYIKENKTETAVPHLSMNDISNFQVMIPNYAEQQKMGTFFSSLDKTITLHQRKLESLCHLKSALLDKMFV